MIKIIRGDEEEGKVDLPAGIDASVSGEGRISVTRDFYCSTPLFYFVESNELTVSDSYIELVGFLNGNEKQLLADEEYINLYIAFQTPHSSRTIIKSVRRLRPGERITIDSVGSFNSQFVARVTKPTSHYTSIELRSRLDSILMTLDPDNTTFHISSGLDSSILAIRAAKLFSERRINLATCLTRGSGCSNELENSERLANEIGADFIAYDLTDVDIFAEGETLLTKCLGFPIAHPSHIVEFLLNNRIISSGANTIVNGKGPDDSLAGYSWHLDKFKKADVHKTRLTVTNDADLVEMTGSSINLDARDNIWRDSEGDLSLSERLEFDARSITDAWNIIHSSLARSLNTKIVSPFMDPNLRSKLFSLPDNQKINNHQQKYFLRKAFMKDYPEYILNFSKHGFRLDLQPYFKDYNSDELYLKITRDMPWVGEIFNPAKIKMMIGSTLSGERNYGWQLWSIFCVVTVLSH